MPRGVASEVGAERKAPNGYWYVKVAERGWVLKHWLVKEAELGRQIEKGREQVRFKDGNSENFHPSNIVLIPVGKSQIRAKLARLYVQRDEVAAQIKYYEDKLAQENKNNDS